MGLNISIELVLTKLKFVFVIETFQEVPLFVFDPREASKLDQVNTVERNSRRLPARVQKGTRTSQKAAAVPSRSRLGPREKVNN